jgi:hypothetical protein
VQTIPLHRGFFDALNTTKACGFRSLLNPPEEKADWDFVVSTLRVEIPSPVSGQQCCLFLLVKRLSIKPAVTGEESLEEGKLLCESTKLLQ